MRIEVKSYTVNLPNCSSQYAYIMLFGADSSGKSFRIRLNFSDLPNTNTYSLQQNGDFVSVPMNIVLFESTVDVLRNEKPVYFNWSTTSKIGIVSTNKEPVGEAEV